jgi:flagellar biosynthesis component FlhA
MDELEADYSAGRIDKAEYERRKEEIEKRSAVY